MITAAASVRKFHSVVGFSMLVVLFLMIGVQMGFTGEDDVKKEDFQVSVDGRHVKFTTPSIFKDGEWFVPLEHFAEQLDLKVEYGCVKFLAAYYLR